MDAPEPAATAAEPVPSGQTDEDRELALAIAASLSEEPPKVASSRPGRQRSGLVVGVGICCVSGVLAACGVSGSQPVLCAAGLRRRRPPAHTQNRAKETGWGVNGGRTWGGGESRRAADHELEP